MTTYLRFQCYSSIDRTTWETLCPDFVTAPDTHFGYGQTFRIGDKTTDNATWQRFVVADVPHMKQIDDPNQPGQQALLLEVFWAKHEEWEQFGLSPIMQHIVEWEKEGRPDRLTGPAKA